MHNDAEAHPGVGAELLNQARLFNAQRRKWGVLFTNYDTLSALNTDMMEDVGDWDTVFTQYFCDNDYYRRVRLAGWETICTDLKVEHVGSQTIHSDPALMNRNRATFLLYRDYYARKWGGEPGSETFNVPWGGE
jgi:GT2 family glycosyltransferase